MSSEDDKHALAPEEVSRGEHPSGSRRKKSRKRAKRERREQRRDKRRANAADAAEPAEDNRKRRIKKQARAQRGADEHVPAGAAKSREKKRGSAKKRPEQRQIDVPDDGVSAQAAELPEKKDGTVEKKRRRQRVSAPEVESPESQAEEERVDEAEPEVDAFSDEALLEESVEPEAVRERRRKRLVSPFTVRIVADDAAVLPSQFFDHLKSAFADAGMELTAATGDADLVLNFCASGSEDIQQGTRATALIALPDSIEGGGASLARAAVAAGAAFIPAAALLRRYSELSSTSPDWTLNDSAGAELATAVRDLVLLRQDDAAFWPSDRNAERQDIAEAITLSESPSEFLKRLAWSGKLLPASLRTPFDSKSIERFLDGNIQLTVNGERQPVAFYLPFDWTAKRDARADQAALHSLEFVTAILNYWYFVANGGKSKALEHVQAALKHRGITASQLLGAAGAIIADYLRATQALPQEAWKVRAMQQRARAFLLFLLCCRMAAIRRIKFDEAVCGPVFRGLIDLLERLRPTALLAPAAAKGVSYSRAVAALALSLRNIGYGASLLDEALENLNRYHLEPGLSADGVWREGLLQHGAVFTALRSLGSDLRSCGLSNRILAPALSSMAQFIAAFVASKDKCPPITELPPVSFGKYARSARAVLSSIGAAARASGSEISGNASFFPDAGLFISRSAERRGAIGSQLVLHARAVQSGGPSISFCYGPDPLIIGGGTVGRKASRAARAATRDDPAAHNTVRIEGLSYRNARPEGSLRIENAWAEKNWGAARLTNEAFAEASIARTVIHLSSLHALLVIDELISHRGDVRFEQFWHLAAGLQTQSDAELPVIVATPEGRTLTVAFDTTVGDDVVELRSGGEDGIGWTSVSQREIAANPYLIRTRKAERAVLGTFFRTGRATTPPQLTTEWNADGWRAAVKMGASELAVTFAGGQLQLTVP